MPADELWEEELLREFELRVMDEVATRVEREQALAGRKNAVSRGASPAVCTALSSLDDAMPDSTSGQAPRRPARVGGDRGTQRAPVPRLADAHHVAARAPRGPLDPHRGRRQPNRRQLCAGDDSRAHPRSLDRGRLGQPLEWEDYDLLQQGCSRGQDGHGRLARCGLVELRGESSRSQGAIDHTDSAMSFAHLRQGDFLPGASWYEETDRSVTRDAGETLARVCSRDEGARPLLDEKGPVSRAFLFVGGA